MEALAIMPALRAAATVAAVVAPATLTATRQLRLGIEQTEASKGQFVCPSVHTLRLVPTSVEIILELAAMRRIIYGTSASN